MYADCWNFKTLKVSVTILNAMREETGSQLGWGVKHVCYYYNWSSDFSIFLISYIFQLFLFPCIVNLRGIQGAGGEFYLP